LIIYRSPHWNPGPRHERARHPGGKSSGRSRSAPAIGRDGGRDTGNELTDGGSVGGFPYDNAVRVFVAENQLGDIEEHTKDGALGHEGLLHEYDGRFNVKTLPADPKMIHNHQNNDYILSDERLRRLMDCDRVSEIDTIVPRRNLSVLDVTALNFNKMVIWPLSLF
jgi:hypothetical protein